MATQDPLLPVRHAQPDLFSIDVTSISLKDASQHLEHPFFVLSNKRDTEIRHYEDRNGNSITITPSALGMPTIRDKDILIYAISHIMHRKNRGEPISRRVVIYSADVLRFANRHLSGRDYDSLDRAIRRLRGCTIQTNIPAGDNIHTDFFGLLDSAALQRKYDTKGRLMHCEITLSEWLWRAIQADEVLTLHSDYFRLRRPLDRRLYEIARKHCGRQPGWTIRLNLLRKKCAYQAPLPVFRQNIRDIASQAADNHNYLPGYIIEYLEGQDLVRFRPRPGEAIPLPDPGNEFSQDTWRAMQKLAPDHDPRELCRLWHAWRKKRKLPPPHDPEAAFLGFVNCIRPARQPSRRRRLQTAPTRRRTHRAQGPRLVDPPPRKRPPRPGAAPPCLPHPRRKPLPQRQTTRRILLPQPWPPQAALSHPACMALTQQRYQSRHRIFRISLRCFSSHRVGGSQFSGMILVTDLGGRTPVLS